MTDDGTALLLAGIQTPWNALHENPHSDSMGDALRLAADLRIDVFVRDVWSEAVGPMTIGFHEMHGNDRHAATRRAIVRAAAALADR